MTDIVPGGRPPAEHPAPYVPPVLRSTPNPEPSASGEGIPLREYLGALRRYAWLIVLAVTLSMGFVAWKIHRELPRYAASSSVQLVDKREAMAGGIAPGAAPDLSAWSDPVLSQLQVLRSRAVAGEVVDSVGLRLQPVDPTFPWAVLASVRVADEARAGDTLRVVFRADGVEGRMDGRTVRAAYGQPLDLGLVSLRFDGRPAGRPAESFQIIDRQAAVLGALGSLTATPREMTSAVDIQYTATDPDLAQRAANAFARTFQSVSMRSAQTLSRRRRQFVEQQLRSTDSLLLIGQSQLSAFRKGVQAFSPREKYRTTEEGLAGFRIQRQALSAERGIYDQMFRELQADRGREGAEQIAALAASPEVASNGGIVSLYQQLIRYQTARDSATTGRWARAAGNPDVQQLDSLISTYKRRLVRAVQARSEALGAQIGLLDEVMSQDAASIAGLPDAEAEESRLSREVETLQKLVDDLRREQQEARIDEAVEAGQVDLLDSALVPGAPVGTGAKRRLFFALLVGLVVGSGGALALDRLNTAVSRREEVEAAMHVPVVAVIPQLGDPQRPRRPLPGRRLLGRRREPEPSEALVAVTDVQSAGSQAYRKLRTHLIFSQQGAPIRTLLVTSPSAAEGKTTVSANLAAAFAQQGMRVAVVDADLRRARLHGLYGVARTPGLTEVLLGEVPVDRALRPSTLVEGLSILAAGRLVPHVSELLGGAGMGRLMRELGERFDLVVVDTPPVLAAADAEILGAQSDALLMVVRAGQTERQSARYAAEQLRGVGARIVGAVLNDPDQKIAGYGRYAYYYDEYADPQG